jgi:hypothetical protein
MMMVCVEISSKVCTDVKHDAGQVILGVGMEEIIARPPLADFYTQVSGLYLLPEQVANDGTIVSIAARGILTDINYEIFMRNNHGQFFLTGYLFVVVFRLDAGGESFQLIHGPEILHHTIGSSGTVRLDWPVRRGDRVGALIPDSCFNDTDPSPFPCPSQMNLRVVPTDCSSAFYYPIEAGFSDTNLAARLASLPADQFVEEQVLLNMEVTISETTGM